MPATNPLNEAERLKVRYHLGYPCTGPSAPSIQLGIAKPQMTSFMVEQAMDLLSDDACILVRELLCKLNATEQRMFAKQNELSVASVGGVTLRGAKRDERITDMLEREYQRWMDRLADMLGSPKYPYSTKVRSGRRGNVPVRG